VIIKEWLYRITKKVADEEHSPVLYANAVHHRSDAYSSFVALFAILGSSIFLALPLDPLGGLLVSFVILRQGVELLGGAFAELTDAGILARSRDKLMRTLDPLLDHPGDGWCSRARDQGIEGKANWVVDERRPHRRRASRDHHSGHD